MPSISLTKPLLQDRIKNGVSIGLFPLAVGKCIWKCVFTNYYPILQKGLCQTSRGHTEGFISAIAALHRGYKCPANYSFLSARGLIPQYPPQ